jgi:CMP/dCMP kinase
MKDHAVVAIDGPAASGKSTVARQVAHRLRRLYLDSGALYRGLTWHALERGADCDDAAALTRLAEDLNVECALDDDAVRYSLNGAVMGAQIRTPSVDAAVSRVAAVARIRRLVRGWLRDATQLGPLVAEGRDIGTAVFPDARHKFYLDASPEERARRRYGELADRQAAVTAAEVDRALRRRDAMDAARRADPLKIAPDALKIDTTGRSVAEVVNEIVRRVLK